ncbi:MAG: diacylglycerol/lipid kinase family protein [Ilumatobacter sp.]|jgi:diacylglycerol kinase (ATP)|uniref:diacylglycerol/lipid kinase family protein n=1 Tax=Ilumatobacter sp. TaxID=1967498 RepID=UPI00391BA371
MEAVDVLGNAAAKGGRQHLDRVVDSLERRGVEARLIQASSPEQARAGAQRAVADGTRRLIAVGGDGVVHLAVTAVATTNTVLGVVPFGTGNDFARALGLLDGDIDAQIDRALAAPVAVDAIRTSHGWVATVATLGFSGDVTERANALRWPRGQHRYTVATLMQLPRLRTLPVVVEVDGRSVGGDTTLLAVGNTAYFGGGMLICPAARPADGRVQVVSIGAVSRLRFLRVFPSVFSGRHVERREVDVAQGSRVTVSGASSSDGSAPALDVWADGERLGSLPIELEVVPGALAVAGARLEHGTDG